jgi:hypothetical protein
MDANANKGATTVFNGSKYFWSAKRMVDVLVAFHAALDVYEVVVYDPLLDKELPRLFICGKTLFSMVGNDAIAIKLSSAKQSGVFVSDKMIADATNSVVSEFILARLLVSGGSSADAPLSVSMHVQQTVNYNAADLNMTSFLLCTKPLALREYKLVHTP